MIEFLWPYMLLFLPLPFIIRWVIFTSDSKARSDRLKVPFFSDIKKIRPRASGHKSKSNLMFLLMLIAWILIVMAGARPIEIGSNWQTDVKGRDLMIAIDTSGSMARPETTSGIKSTRLDTVKSITSELIKKRKGDRVGIIVFGTKAFLYTPLSFDLFLVSAFLEDAFAGMAGPKTAIGDALALSVKYLYSRPSEEKVLLLMTDGENQGGEYTIDQSLELVKKASIKVYAIGIGFSDKAGDSPIKDSEIDLDEPALINIASETGGRYFRVNSADDLKNVFNVIGELEQINEVLVKQNGKDIYYIFIMWAMFVMGLMFALYVYSIYSARKENESGGV